MNKQSYLGEFEYLLLLNILSLKEQAYGVTIRERFNLSIGRDVSIGAIYATSERLEKKGYLTSRKGGATAERGGKAKRFYQVTSSGKEAVVQTKEYMDAMWETAASSSWQTI